VRNDATVFPDISKENISAKIPTRCFSGTLPHSLTRTTYMLSILRVASIFRKQGEDMGVCTPKALIDF